MKPIALGFFVFLFFNAYSQNELKNWYFGNGTDGLVFNNNIPQKVSNKSFGVGFEGIIVVNEPVTGNLLFYSDGEKVINKNHALMTNGSGLSGHFSGAQCVQSCPLPSSCSQKFYLFTNSAWDQTTGTLSYSIIDFTTNSLGVVTNKNTPLWNGPTSQGMCLVNKPNSYDYWLIVTSFTAQYRVFSITSAGISAPTTYNFSNTGESYQINYDKTTGKLISSGWGNKRITLIDFNATTGVMSNETQLAGPFAAAGYAARFSPNGTKLYAGIATSINGSSKLYQYDFATSSWIDMNTCCYAHDLKVGPDGKMYFINTYYSSQPISVIDFPNLTAVGNACGYQNLTFTTSFNGEVRRFPEFVILPQPPIANTDVVNLAGSSISIPVLQNDSDPQNDPFSIDVIVQNPTFGNAVINGSNINYVATNPSACGIRDSLIYRIKDINCDFDTAMVIINYQACTTNSCNNWLHTPTQNSYVTVGDLDVAGDKLTVEVNYNSTGLSSNGSWGHIVSKHTNTTNVNYALSPNGAEITTTNSGYKVAATSCTSIPLNKTNHLAMVYDGATLKFYSNGFLMSSVPCSGNLVTNNLLTTIAQIAGTPAPSEQFLGFINEVRIWETARTQTELRAYMSTSLPNPTTQAGLKGYYVFNNLLNKQGNAAFNGTLNGGATINATNTNCTLVADSCIVAGPQETIINNYTPILALDPCKNIVTVGNAFAYNVGDTVLMIQMKGAIIDSSNTAAFGNITDYKSAGNYEYNYVKSKTGNQIELKNKILRTYEIPNGKVQLIRVPYYQNYTANSKLTCLPWDGNIGGVLVFNVANTLTLNNDIDVSGRGFRGGTMQNSNFNGVSCGMTDFFFQDNTRFAAGKGEGIATLSPLKSSGKGPLANGGGGGMDTNSGGGGGSNGTIGGRGGFELNGCPNYLFTQNWGFPGKPLVYSNTNNKLFLGGGGGAGHCNNQYDGPTLNANFNGGNGGGIVIIKSNSLIANSFSIKSDGNTAYELNNTSFISHDGMGGGGAGGSILLDIDNYISTTSIKHNGGRGGNMIASPSGGLVGPGGGGAGGILWLKQTTIPANIAVNSLGGLNGVIVQNNNNPYGAAPGQPGQTLFNLNLPVANVEFKPNIDSVKVNVLSASCNTYNFSGLAYTNTNPIATWQWNFGDNTTAFGQNVSHTYSSTNTFTVKLVVTDINGCKDSITRNITTNTLNVDAGNNQTFCGNQIGFQLSGTVTAAGALTYAWTSIPATTISNANVINPTANINATTTFYFTVTTAQGCTGVDSVKVTINPIPVVQTINDIAICKGTTLQLTSTSGLTSYQWTNGIYVSDSTIANPIFIDTVSRTLIITGSNGLCSAKDTVNISIKPLPIVRTIKDTIICSTQNISLTTTGANTYSWTPSTFLSSTTIANPTYIGTGTNNTTTTYYVTGTAANGCSARDTLVVKMNVPNSFIDPPNMSFCKNESVELNGNNGNDVTYNWQPATAISNQNIINPVVNPTSTMPYTVNITDPLCNFSKTFTVVVTVNPLPNITITKSNDVTCNRANTTLIANGAINYNWSNSPSLSNVSIANPVANPSTNTTYTVTGTDINGCKNSNKITVLVNLSKNILDLPNTFTPNADGKNDCFGVLNWGNASDVLFIIYNRWGEKAFETTNINKCWNGEFKGQQAIHGNYVYFIRAKTACGDVVKKGNVLLMR
jgi:gliding motility-associated-like protein